MIRISKTINTLPERILKISFFLIIMIVSCSFTSSAFAAPVVGFNAGLIMDDAVFTYKDSMGVSQIQTFLNSKVAVCDTSGSQPSEFGGGTRAQWATSKGYPPPYTCLRDYSENGQTAAQIIFNVAQTYNINPQVLIVLLQKEQGLITDTWPLSIQYRSATGYGCPDTAPCDSQYYGLMNQLTWSGRMFKSIITASPSWYTPYVMGTNYVRWNPDERCGGANVNIQNRTTQALYNYTPYQPNTYALNGGGSSAYPECGAFGNRNFYQYFKDWFGSPTGPSYAGVISSQALYLDTEHTTPVKKIGSKYILTPGQTVYAKIEAYNTGRGIWNGFGNLGTAAPNDRISSFQAPGWIAPQRPVAVTPNPVAPGQTGTFNFVMKAPNQQGAYSESFSIVIDGQAWTNATATFQIDVTSPSTPITSNNLLNTNGPSTLLAGSTILSPDTYTALSLSPTGVLTLRTNYEITWSAPKNAGAGSRLVMQSDGNLVLYNNALQAVWSSETVSGVGTYTLHVQEDGNLVVYNEATPIWATGTSQSISHFNYTHYVMSSGSIMYPGQKMQSPDKRYTFWFQTDGNLVLYNQISQPIWHSRTPGQPGYVLTMQTDGNLVLYSPTFQPLWASGTQGRGISNFYTQQDGNLVIYGPNGHTWASGTYGR